MRLDMTRVDEAGVFRCCFSAFEGLGGSVEVSVGDKFSCKHCKDGGFVLKERKSQTGKTMQYYWTSLHNERESSK